MYQWTGPVVRNKGGKVNGISKININFWGERERRGEWEGKAGKGRGTNETDKRLRMLL